MRDTRRVELHQTEDPKQVDAIVTSPDVWAWVKDDESSRELFTVKGLIQKGHAQALLVNIDGCNAGVLILLKSGDGLELHTNLTQKCRGSSVIRVAHGLFAHIFGDKNYPYVVTYVFDNDAGRPARLMAKFVGFKEVGRDVHPNLVNGQKTERIWYKITRDEWLNIKNN